MKGLVTGATGFIGKRLLRRLERRVVLTRDAEKAKKTLAEFNASIYEWDADRDPAPLVAFDGVDAVFHLAGDPVAEGRWTEAKKQRIRDSRIMGTRRLVDTLAALEHKPSVLVSGSAVGWYSDRGDETLTERAQPGSDFLADVCVGWEREAMRATELGIRVVTVRTGVVLGQGGGALAKMLTPFRLGAGSPLGSAKQYMPWIHVDDLVDMMIFAAENKSLAGPMNGTAPNPVTNYEFTKTLGKVVGMPTFMPAIPGFMVKLMFGEFGDILLHSQKVQPQAALESGFKFTYPQLEGALRNILK
jgi:uncharacterized protein (TIGR01777 family)